MSWASMFGAWVEPRAYRTAADEPTHLAETQRRVYEQARQEMSPFREIGEAALRKNFLSQLTGHSSFYPTGIHEQQLGKPSAAQCPCCHSRQFVEHHSRRICAYCRSEQ